MVGAMFPHPTVSTNERDECMYDCNTADTARFSQEMDEWAIDSKHGDDDRRDFCTRWHDMWSAIAADDPTDPGRTPLFDHRTLTPGRHGPNELAQKRAN